MENKLERNRTLFEQPGDKMVDDTICYFISRLKEAKSVVDLLKRETMSFEIALEGAGDQKTKISVTNSHPKLSILMDSHIFLEKLSLLKMEMMEMRKALDSNYEYSVPERHDPLYVMFDNDFLIGRVTCWPEYCIYNLETTAKDEILEIKYVVSPFNTVGFLELAWTPLAGPNIEDARNEVRDIFSEKDFLCHPWYYRLDIRGAHLPVHCKKAYIQYYFLGELYTSDVVEYETFSPIFNYSKTHSVSKATPKLLEFLKGSMVIDVHVTQYIGKPPDRICTGNVVVRESIQKNEPSESNREVDHINNQLSVTAINHTSHRVRSISRSATRSTENGSSLLTETGKFDTIPEKFFVFGDEAHYVEGLTTKIKELTRSMEEECTTNDSGKWKEAYNYVVYEKAVEISADPMRPNRVRDKGNGGMTLSDFCNHQTSVNANLTQAEVAALRLYTGPLYEPWNRALRFYSKNPDLLKSWSTCITVLYNAILNLSWQQKAARIVYRGVNETFFRLPDAFLNGVDGDFAGGVELAFMSTSLEKSTALEYSKKGKLNACTIFEITLDKANRGADVQFLSQYSYEKELLYPPCTMITCENVTEEIFDGSKVKYIRARASISIARHDPEQMGITRVLDRGTPNFADGKVNLTPSKLDSKLADKKSSIKKK